MKDVAIIASVIPARYPLLERAYHTWLRAIRSTGLDMGVFLYFDGEDRPGVIDTLTKRYGRSGNIVQFGMPTSGSHIQGYNYGFSAIKAKTYIFTHPEILFPYNTISTAVNAAKPNI
jgi:hypothetical protein